MWTPKKALLQRRKPLCRQLHLYQPLNDHSICHHFYSPEALAEDAIIVKLNGAGMLASFVCGEFEVVVVGEELVETFLGPGEEGFYVLEDEPYVAEFVDGHILEENSRHALEDGSAFDSDSHSISG